MCEEKIGPIWHFNLLTEQIILFSGEIQIIGDASELIFEMAEKLGIKLGLWLIFGIWISYW